MKIEEKYRRKLIREQVRMQYSIRRAFIRVSDKFSKQFGNSPIIRNNDRFTFNTSKRLNIEFTELMEGFTNELFEVTSDSIESAWQVANYMNDEYVMYYFKGLDQFRSQQSAMMSRNAEALDAFMKRKRNSRTLSDRIWKVGARYRDELEANLLIGISEGKSAAGIAEQIEEYLEYPDKLFRRVRDSEGDLRLSKAAKLFKPGKGMYRSSYKNALRVAVSETNMAYRTADNLRWQKQDFILGYDVHLSAQHPVYDICDELEGRYPKDFLYTGWHPRCFCYATPIRMERDDFVAKLNGEQVNVRQVREMPSELRKWVSENKSKVDQMKNKPYFILDNAKKIQKEMNIKF